MDDVLKYTFTVLGATRRRMKAHHPGRKVYFIGRFNPGNDALYYKILPFLIFMISQTCSFSPDSLRRELPPLIDGVSPAGEAVSGYLSAYGLGKRIELTELIL